jgi:hypothetical protein
MNKQLSICLIASSTLSAFVLAGCSGGTTSGTDPDPGNMTTQDMTVASFSVGGTVTGLAGSGLVLQMNGGSDIQMSTSGSFTFSQKVATGMQYAVSVKTQPSAPAQTCTVMNGSGTMGTANVTNVSIVCSTSAFKVGGMVSGLNGSVVLQNNAGDDLTITQSGSFTFATAVAAGANYAVTVKTHPAMQICTVASGSGAIGSADVTSVVVTCGTPKTCKDIKTAKPASTDGDYMIDPDGAGALPAITAYCDMTTDGGGYTMYGVTGGISTSRFDAANSCDALGLKMIIPRTKAHLGAMFKKYGSGYFATVPGIYGKAAGNYTGCVMNSGDATCGANWVALDQGAWFLRDATYTEPNGDYTPGCWLAVTGVPDAQGNGLTFNDANCNYSTGTMYVCSDNAK